MLSGLGLGSNRNEEIPENEEIWTMNTDKAHSSASTPAAREAPADSPLAVSDAELSSVVRQSGRPMAKTKAKKVIPRWEEGSDSDDGGKKSREKEEAERLKSQWVAFHKDEAGSEKDSKDGQASQQGQAQRSWMPSSFFGGSKKDAAEEQATADMPSSLKSYEEEVLKLRSTTKSTELATAKPQIANGDVIPANGDDIEASPEEVDLDMERAREEPEELDAAEREAQKKELEKELEIGEENLMNEQNMIANQQVEDRQEEERTKTASRLIQQLIRIKKKFMGQRMKLFQQAEEMGRDTKMREQRLMVWVALLSVCNKFEAKMHTKEIIEARTIKFLKTLDPPPPPPPKEEPPSEKDEQLHYDYEAARAKWAHVWEKEGRMSLGMEKFAEITTMGRGHAEEEKRKIAEKCLERAVAVMSEQEHQAYLKKAWRLQNDFADESEYNAKDFARRNFVTQQEESEKPAGKRG
eukprot:gnl/TRDRNA2_/TRDRNA2_38811_c0_seq1.p1 gnl/TRDRNA2_/TRDRNA2_38811_c0~~gnl/TRDRNA2_/TRDRNA2_38811_c0_seq1.p1  ORF type:complete len:489 (-),score=151.16 gnl/TRDRNA2_/TRDRNA2_38811_c0_seq1:50-1450(-)